MSDEPGKDGRKCATDYVRSQFRFDAREPATPDQRYYGQTLQCWICDTEGKRIRELPVHCKTIDGLCDGPV